MSKVPSSEFIEMLQRYPIKFNNLELKLNENVFLISNHIDYVENGLFQDLLRQPRSQISQNVNSKLVDYSLNSRVKSDQNHRNGDDFGTRNFLTLNGL